jgi:hypothetical protein
MTQTSKSPILAGTRPASAPFTGLSAVAVVGPPLTAGGGNRRGFFTPVHGGSRMVWLQPSNSPKLIVPLLMLYSSRCGVTQSASRRLYAGGLRWPRTAGIKPAARCVISARVGYKGSNRWPGGGFLGRPPKTIAAFGLFFSPVHGAFRASGNRPTVDGGLVDKPHAFSPVHGASRGLV